MALAVPLHLNRQEDGNLIYFVELIRCYVLLLLDYAFQLFLLLEIWTVIDKKEEDAECNDDLFAVQLTCVFIFQAAVLQEILSTIDIYRLLYYAEAHQRSRLRLGSDEHGAVLAHESNSKFSLKRFRPKPPPEMPQWKLDGINIPFKIWSAMIVVTPKLVITVTLSYVGGLFIALCDSVEDIVLNTLAVNFVCDLNTILYGCFIQQTVKDSIEHMQTVEIDLDNKHRIGHWLTSTVLYPATTVALTFFTVVYTQGCGAEYLPGPLADLVGHGHTVTLDG